MLLKFDSKKIPLHKSFCHNENQLNTSRCLFSELF